ncbi:MAG: hypothetical protein NTX13_10235 [Acidobacteria bacterium]|jgi:hypothetical protein|nr:hypothetical protein [Acidobacteriota bacterium]
MRTLFSQIAVFDECLLAIPFGAETEALPLLALRGELVALVAAGPMAAEDAEPLHRLEVSTLALQERYAHIRRRLAAEIGESGSHRQFLETLADSLEPAAPSDRIFA